MQQLLQLKTEPQDSVSTEDLFGLDPINESSGQSTGLRDLLSNLFTSSFLLELKEETKSLDITLDEEEKKLILKLKKKTKSKYLAKKGQVYALRKELKMTSLTLVYNYQPNYGIQNELQSITPIEPMTNIVKPLEVTQPKSMMSDALKLSIKPPIFIDTPEDITIVLPLPEYTGNLLRELPTKPYEEKFKPFNRADTYSEETVPNPEDYPIGPEKVRREDLKPENLVQEYNQTSNFQTLKQKFVHNVYENPIEIDHEKVFEEYIFTSEKWTTAYQAMLDSGLKISDRNDSKFPGKYIVGVNGSNEHDDNSNEHDNNYWEIIANGQYIPVTADRYLVSPGVEITLRRKTAESGACGGSAN